MTEVQHQMQAAEAYLELPGRPDLMLGMLQAHILASELMLILAELCMTTRGQMATQKRKVSTE